MADEIPPPAPAPSPVAVTVQPPAPVVPTTAQVVSAAVQNIVVALILGAGWLYGKLDTTVAVVALLLVVGIDFAGRKRLASGSTTAAVALGATGILQVLGLTGIVAAAALALAGCTPADAAALRHTPDDLRHAYDSVCSEPVSHAVHALPTDDADAGTPAP